MTRNSATQRRKPQTTDLPTVELGGKERTLRFDFNALADIEAETGRPAMEFFNDLLVTEQEGRQVRITDLIVLLWAGLRHEDETLTKREVGSWVDLRNFNDTFGVVAESFAAAMPQAEEGQVAVEQNGSEPKNSTGEPYGQ